MSTREGVKKLNRQVVMQFGNEVSTNRQVLMQFEASSSEFKL